MVGPRLFKLKSQLAPSPAGPVASEHSCARIWVDTGVFHLDQAFDYLIPEKLSSLIQVGIKVQVPFGSREVEGLVISRIESPTTTSKLKLITKVLSPHRVANSCSINLISLVAQHWAANPWEIISSAIPARVASVDKKFEIQDSLFDEASAQGRGELTFRSFDPHQNPYSLTAQLALEIAAKNAVLIIAPDERDVVQLIKSLNFMGKSPLRIDSGASREERYTNFLKILREQNQIAIGSRNAIFAPVPKGSSIIVFNESSMQMYERRSPGWNVRDIALIRRDTENLNVHFCGYVPSIELAALIESKKIRYFSTKSQLKVKAFSPQDSSLLPGRIFTDIRAALRDGAVLFIFPRKGYANALICAHCKNYASCKCGGRLHVATKNSHPQCRVCGTDYGDWKCDYCGRAKGYEVSRGIEKASEEISRAFPNIPITLSYGDVIKDVVESKPSIVVSTPGAAPYAKDGYSAVVILEGLSYFAHDDLRANERAWELFFQTSSLVKKSGTVLLAIEDSHPIVSALIRWNPALILQKELEQRGEIHFPPLVHSAIFTCPTNEISAIARGIRIAIDETRLPRDVRVLGPVSIDAQKSKLVLLFDSESENTSVEFMHELMRRRSIAGKTEATLRIDPYTI